jgi:hypothetical protein
MRYEDTNESSPRATKIATSSSANAIGGSVACRLAPKPPSSSGFISAGKSGSVAAAAIMASTPTANSFACGRTYPSSRR